MLKKALGDADDLSGYKAELPRFVIPMPNAVGILFVHTPASVVQTRRVHTELFGMADSSAAFGVGMTRTIEQDDPESFSANYKAAWDGTGRS